MIKGLHHNAYRCRDSEETRAFYEDFLGLPLKRVIPITQTATGRKTNVLHSFFEMGDGSFLAFFDDPETPFEFKEQRDFDLHIALAVAPEQLEAMLDKGKAERREVRGPIDHGLIRSIYFRDPNGYVIELTAPTGRTPDMSDPAQSRPHEVLARWEDWKAQQRR